MPQQWYAPSVGSGWVQSGPYATNVVWQDTTSNATYCSVTTALSSSGKATNKT